MRHLILLLIATATLVFGEDSKTIEARLNSKLHNAVLVLRTPLVGTKLKFGADGHSKNDVGIRGFDDKFQVSGVELRDTKLVIKGVRLHDVYDPQLKRVSLASVVEPVEVVLQLSNPNEDASISADYYKVFLPSAELEKQSCSELGYLAKMWEMATKAANILDVHNSKKTIESREVCLPSGFKGWLLGNGPEVVYPRPIKDPDPRYPNVELAAGKQGFAEFVIRVDESGRISDGVVLKTDTLGFIRKSTTSFDKWRFTPGKKDGAAIATVLTIEMHFHLMK
jgi:hypothetical protein